MCNSSLHMGKVTKKALEEPPVVRAKQLFFIRKRKAS